LAESYVWEWCKKCAVGEKWRHAVGFDSGVMRDSAAFLTT